MKLGVDEPLDSEIVRIASRRHQQALKSSYCFSSGQTDSLAGLNASAAGMLPVTLK